MHSIYKRTLSKLLAYRDRSKTQAKRRFVLGAQLYAQARNATTSFSSKAVSKPLAKQAENKADQAISVDPKDAASHILKALTLDIQGFKSYAPSSIYVALSPLIAGSFSYMEKGDALFKRAELLLSGKGIKVKGGVESVIGDLTKAVKLSPDNAAAFCLLGECYEGKKMKDEAKNTYEAAFNVQPELVMVPQLG